MSLRERLLDLLYPPKCPFCGKVLDSGKPGRCASCQKDLPWTAKGEHLLLLQPMTKVEYLRKWLVDNGYYFTEERLVFDKNYRYPVFAVRGGAQPPLTLTQQYGGVLLDGAPLYADYLDVSCKRPLTVPGVPVRQKTP